MEGAKKLNDWRRLGGGVYPYSSWAPEMKKVMSPEKSREYFEKLEQEKLEKENAERQQAEDIVNHIKSEHSKEKSKTIVK